VELGIRKSKIAVLAGGIGAESQISIQSGRSVAGALQKAGMNVTLCDIRPDEMAVLEDSSIDVFFIALHGQFGEDGQLQQVLEEKGLVYTGSGPAASRLAFDKMASKKVFEQAGIATAAAIEYNNDGNTKQIREQLEQLGTKYVVKPKRQGSSVGVSIVEGAQHAVTAAKKTSTEFGDCMIERFIPGREITVGILAGRALPIIEIQAGGGFYDYNAKYIDDQTFFLFNTIEDNGLVKQIQATALKCFNVLGCSDFARVDMILAEDNKAYVLEVNTIPGFTNHSLLPLAAADEKLSISQLCIQIIESAFAGKPDKDPINNKLFCGMKIAETAAKVDAASGVKSNI
jgi:D-alanine-D-alanine ligase